jgi:hypothetical protein
MSLPQTMTNVEPPAWTPMDYVKSSDSEEDKEEKYLSTLSFAKEDDKVVYILYPYRITYYSSSYHISC